MNIKVIASSKQLLQAEDIAEVYLPAETGEIGILPGHINLITTLDVGEMKLLHNNKEQETFLLNGGILQVENDNIMVLADEAALPEELVAEEIKEAIKRAEEKLAGDLDPTELIQLEKKLRYEKFKQDKLLAS